MDENFLMKLSSNEKAGLVLTRKKFIVTIIHLTAHCKDRLILKEMVYFTAPIHRQQHSDKSLHQYCRHLAYLIFYPLILSGDCSFYTIVKTRQCVAVTPLQDTCRLI